MKNRGSAIFVLLAFILWILVKPYWNQMLFMSLDHWIVRFIINMIYVYRYAGIAILIWFAWDYLNPHEVGKAFMALTAVGLVSTIYFAMFRIFGTGSTLYTYGQDVNAVSTLLFIGVIGFIAYLWKNQPFEEDKNIAITIIALRLGIMFITQYDGIVNTLMGDIYDVLKVLYIIVEILHYGAIIWFIVTMDGYPSVPIQQKQQMHAETSVWEKRGE